MRVTITALKAPWPKGSKVGSVVELEGDTIPAWAAGKCTPAVILGGGGSGPPALPSAAEMDQIKTAFEDLRNQLTVAESEGHSTRTQLEAVRAENAALKALLEAGGGGSGPIKPQGEPGAEAVVAGGGGSGPIKPNAAKK